MRIVAFSALAILAVTCGPDPNAKLPGMPDAKGGATSQAGTGGGATGGTKAVGTGGRTTVASGGTTAGNGGRFGSGGRSGTGGVSGAGGTLNGSGGRTTGTGGRTTTPDAGGDGRVRDTASGSGGSTLVGSGGSTTEASGGRLGSGGRTGSGGAIGRDGGGDSGGVGGITGSGGATVPRDGAAGRDLPSTCVTAVVDNAYACGSATSCAECKDNNGNSREDGCKKGIDCLANAGAACDTNCQMNCWNLGGDQYGIACVKALQTAACSGSGC